MSKKIHAKITDYMEKQEKFFQEIKNYLDEHAEDKNCSDNLTNYLLSAPFVQSQITNTVTAEQKVQQIMKAYLDWLKHGSYLQRIERKITLESLGETEYKDLQVEFKNRGFKFTKRKYPVKDQLVKASKIHFKKERKARIGLTKYY